MHKKRKLMRRRLIGLLALLCAVGALCAGTIAAAGAHAATARAEGRGKAASSRASDVRRLSASQEKALLAEITPANGGGIQFLASSMGSSGFTIQTREQAMVSYANYESGYLSIPEGVGLQIFSGMYSNSVCGGVCNLNDMSIKQIVEVLEEGGWASSMTLQAVTQNGGGGNYPFLGEVSYTNGITDPRPWTEDEIQDSGYMPSLQNTFLSDCMGYLDVSNGHGGFSSLGPTDDTTTPRGLVEDGLLGNLTSGDLTVVKPGLEKIGVSEEEANEIMAGLEEIFSSSEFETFKEKFETWEKKMEIENGHVAYTKPELYAAADAAQTLMDDFPSLSKMLPEVCQSVWTEEVNTNEYENGALISTGEWSMPYSPSNNLPSDSNYEWYLDGEGPAISGCGNNTDFDYDSSNNTYSTAKGCGISIYVGTLGTRWIYDSLFDGQEGTFHVEATFFIDTSAKTSPAYSDPGALILTQINNPVQDDYQFTNTLVRETGTSSDSFNPTSTATDFSTSTPSSSGLWFKAEDREGKPLKEVTVALYLKSLPSTFQSGLITSTDMYWIPLPWTGPNYKGADSYTGAGELSSALSSGDVTSNREGGLIGYFWAAQGDTFSSYMGIPLQQISNQPGVFEISGLPFGTYQVTVISGETEDGTKISYGSYYSAPTFQVELKTNTGSGEGFFSSTPPEEMSAVSDPCGFVNPEEDEVVMDSSNPSSEGGTDASALSSSDFTSTVGEGNYYYYKSSAYLPFDLSGVSDSTGASASSSPFSFSLKTPGQQVVESSVELNGEPLSSLSAQINVSSPGGMDISLPPSALASLLQKSGGSHVVAVSWKAYLTKSFASSTSASFEFNYLAYGTSNPNNTTKTLEPLVETNGPANDSYSSLSPSASDPSSKTGLWWNELQADGSGASGAEFTVQNSEGEYLAPSSTGWTFSSSPYDFSEQKAGLFGFGGLSNGSYTVTLVKWPSSTPSSRDDDAFGNNWPSAAGYPGSIMESTSGTDFGVKGSFQVSLSYSSPEDLSAEADPMGLVDSAKDAMYSPSLIEMNVMDGSSFTSSSKPYEALNSSFTEGWKGYLPLSTTPSSSAQGKNGYDSSMKVTLMPAVSGLEIGSDFASSAKVAGVPLSTLEKEGASVSSPSSGKEEIQLSSSALSYLQEHGENAEGSPLSSSSNRQIYITFPASVTSLDPGVKTFDQAVGFGLEHYGWWQQGEGWYVSSYPIYTYVSSHALPFTGGKPLALILSASAFLLLALGLGAYLASKKKKA